MDVGEKRHRISFEENIGKKANEKGFREDKYINYRTVWAKLNNLWGREFWAAKAIKQENTVVFEIRYSKDLENLDTKKYRINFKGRYFNIVHIDNVLYKNISLKIKAIELV